MDANTVTQLKDQLTTMRIKICKAYEEGNWQYALQLSREIDAYQLNQWLLKEGALQLSV